MTTEARPFKRLSPLSPLVRSGIFLVAVVGATWGDLIRGDLGPTGIVLLGLLVAGLIYGAVSWWRTKYWIEGDELRVDTGVVSRQSRRIRVDRLQSIDIAQPLLARLFGLAELKMDVAGGGRAEGSLAFMSLKEAHELREMLLARRSESAASPQAPADNRATAPEQVIAKLDLGRLLASILLSGHTVGVLVSGGITVVIFVTTGQFAGAASMVPILGGFVLAQMRRLSAFYNFTVAQTPAGLLVRRGLFELDHQTIALHRVQGVRITEPVFWRGFGWARLDVSVAGVKDSEGQGKPSASTVMPVAPLPMVQALARHLLSGSPGATSDPATVELVRPPRRARWVAPVWRHYLAFGIGPGILVSRRGMLTRRTDVVPHARVQSAHVDQGPIQRALGLADLSVDSPPGPVALRGRHLEASAVRALLSEATRAARAARVTVASDSRRWS